MKLRPMILSSMFAAMVTVATMIIKVPTVGTGGYVNIGDSIVLVSAWTLGNPYGALAAGIGSALADLLSGYPVYVPGTAVIKFMMAFVAAGIGRSKNSLHKNRFPIIAKAGDGDCVSEVFGQSDEMHYGKEVHIPTGVCYFISGVAAEVVMVVGYFLYEATVLGYGIAAAASISGNVVQGTVCIAIGLVLIGALSRVPALRSLAD